LLNLFLERVEGLLLSEKVFLAEEEVDVDVLEVVGCQEVRVLRGEVGPEEL